jgi:hypothetical protein
LPQKEFVLKDYGYQDLSDRLDLLATLYHDSGQLKQAVAVLEESQRLCQEQGLIFDGQGLLDEYLLEMGGRKPGAGATNGRHATQKRRRA